jgi:hypothetical protein
MKNLILLIVTFTIATGVYSQDSKMMAQPNKMDQKKMKDCCTMKDGKMVCMKDGKTMAMTMDMTLKNGTTVMKDGTVKMKDGKTMMMKNGDAVDMDGKMMKMPMDKMDKTKKMDKMDNSKM